MPPDVAAVSVVATLIGLAVGVTIHRQANNLQHDAFHRAQLQRLDEARQVQQSMVRLHDASIRLNLSSVRIQGPTPSIGDGLVLTEPFQHEPDRGLAAERLDRQGNLMLPGKYDRSAAGSGSAWTNKIKRRKAAIRRAIQAL